MAKYKAYPEYKDSGVEWLGGIPSHWRTNKLRYLFNFGKGLTITKENLQVYGIPCISYGEIHSKYGFEVSPQIHPLKCVDEKYLKDNSTSLLLKGDIIFADTSEDIDGSGNFSQLISDDIVFAGYHTIIAKPSNRKNWRFYAYLLDCKELRTQVRYAVKGVKVFSITQAILRGISVWLPSDDEQEKIARFLDHETAKIDNLIEKQQQLIELLKEKRQAVISHAATKGLNPDAPMKDSGVQCLGKIPKHWNASKLGYLAIKIGSGKTPKGGSETYLSEGVLFLRSQNIYSDGLKVNPSECVYINFKTHNEMNNTRVFEGDILLNITGASIGRSCIVPTPFIEANVNQHVCILRFKKNIRDFISYFMKSLTVKEQINICQVGGNREGLNFEQISKIKISLPPENEMLSILDHLKIRLSILDNLEKKAFDIIQLLKERRTALISAAVTGKIDVRNWRAPNEQTTAEAEAAQ